MVTNKKNRRSNISDAELERVDELAHEFVERQRLGERVSIDEYVQQNPALADEIRDLFPTVLAMERLTRRKKTSANGYSGLDIKQLGDYRIIGEIARGGMGIVYEAEQITLGRRVAVKVLPSHVLTTDNEIRRFQREARTAAKLHHSNIVPVFGVGEQDGLHFLVMQFIQGVGLDEILTELRRIILQQRSVGSPSSVRSNNAKQNALALMEGKLDTQAGDLTATGRIQYDDTQEPNSLPTSPNGKRSGHCELDGTDSPPVQTACHQVVGRQKESNRLGKEYIRNVVSLIIQAANALQYAHTTGTQHRDVKPGNLLFDDKGSIWVTDFGLAKGSEKDAVTLTGDLVGTISYLAPERLRGESDARSDIYSLGLTLYEMLTLKRPFEASDRVELINQVANRQVTPPRKINAMVPRDLETIVLKSISRDPESRYQTAELLAEDLTRFLQNRPISARRVNPIERFARTCRRNPLVSTLSMVVVVLLISFSILSYHNYVRELRHRQKAETTLQLAVDALDKIYAQFTPNIAGVIQNGPIADDPNVVDDGNSNLADASTEILLQPDHIPVSPEAARLLDSLLDFYDQLSTQSGDAENILKKSMSASRRVGDIQARLGALQKARDAYLAAIHKSEKLETSKRSSIELARTYNGLGLVLSQLHKNGQAIDAYKNSIRILQDEESAEAKFELAQSFFNLHIAEFFHRARHRKRYREIDIGNLKKCRIILSELLAENPKNPEYSFLMAKSYRAKWFDHAHQEHAIKTLEYLVEQHPKVPDFRYELGAAYTAQYGGYFFRKNPDAEAFQRAEHRLRQAVHVVQGLSLNHPNEQSYLLQNVRIHYRLGSVLYELKRYADANREFLTALSNQEKIISNSDSPTKHEIYGTRIELALAKSLLASAARKEAENRLQLTLDKLKTIITRGDVDRFSRSFAKSVQDDCEKVLTVSSGDDI